MLFEPRDNLTKPEDLSSLTVRKTGAISLHASNYQALATKAKQKASRFKKTLIRNGVPIEEPKIQRNFPSDD